MCISTGTMSDVPSLKRTYTSAFLFQYLPIEHDQLIHYCLPNVPAAREVVLYFTNLRFGLPCFDILNVQMHLSLSFLRAHTHCRCIYTHMYKQALSYSHSHTHTHTHTHFLLISSPAAATVSALKEDTAMLNSFPLPSGSLHSSTSIELAPLV